MIIEKLEISLHDRSLIQVSRTDSGALYMEVYGPGHAKDGHGMLLRGSAVLTADQTKKLVNLILSPNPHQMATLRDYIRLLTVPLTPASTPLTGGKTGGKTGCEKVSKKTNEITKRL